MCLQGVPAEDGGWDKAQSGGEVRRESSVAFTRVELWGLLQELYYRGGEETGELDLEEWRQR